MGRSGLPDSTYFVTKRMGRAAYAEKMLRDGEGILVPLAGGFSSLAMLRALVERNRRLPIRNHFHPVHVEDGVYGPAKDVIPFLERSCAEQGLSLTVLRPDSPPMDRFEAFPHRQMLLHAARGLHCPVVALGQTAQDLALWLLSTMGTRGTMDRMKSLETVMSGNAEVRVIRPLWLLTLEQIMAMVKDEGMVVREPVLERPDAEFRRLCLEFLSDKKVDLVEQLRNIALAPDRVAEEYLV